MLESDKVFLKSGVVFDYDFMLRLIGVFLLVIVNVLLSLVNWFVNGRIF